ncbi:hypothetical protein [Mycoplasma sp. 1012]
MNELKIKKTFNEIFSWKSHYDEENSLSCGYKKQYYHFLSYDSKTNTIYYRVSDSNNPEDNNAFYYDTSIKYEKMLEIKK